MFSIHLRLFILFTSIRLPAEKTCFDLIKNFKTMNPSRRYIQTTKWFDDTSVPKGMTGVVPDGWCQMGGARWVVPDAWC